MLPPSPGDIFARSASWYTVAVHRHSRIANVLIPVLAAGVALCAIPATAQRRAVGSSPRVADIALSNTHACARMANGSVRCWGFNRNGEVGDGTTVPRLSPVVARAITHATSLALGAGWTCALAANGVRCWGRDDAGQFGDGGASAQSHPAPVTVRSLHGATQLALGAEQSCARMRDGHALCWQHTSGGIRAAGAAPPPPAAPPAAVNGLTTVVEVTVGASHACARLADGTARCWGDNHFGQLGDGTYTQRPLPAEVYNLAHIAQIAAGGNRTCARMDDGTVKCWGMNTYGQLGDGTSNNHEQAMAVSGLGGVAEIALGDSHACARINDGTVKCWGLNDGGQLGDGTRTNRFAPVTVSGLTNVVQVAAGGNASCARTSDGAVVCWGFGGAGQLGNGTDANRVSPTAVVF